jgi:hypothetical protein
MAINMAINVKRSFVHGHAHFRKLSLSISHNMKFNQVSHFEGASGSVVGSGTVLKAGRWRIQFLIKSFDLIHSATLWPWGQLSL